MKRNILIMVVGLFSLSAYYWTLPDEKTRSTHQAPTIENSSDSYQNIFTKIHHTNQRINALSPYNQTFPKINFMNQAGVNGDIYQYLNDTNQPNQNTNKQRSSNNRSHK